jgi:hypothetical protein
MVPRLLALQIRSLNPWSGNRFPVKSVVGYVRIRFGILLLHRLEQGVDSRQLLAFVMDTTWADIPVVDIEVGDSPA